MTFAVLTQLKGPQPLAAFFSFVYPKAKRRGPQRKSKGAVVILCAARRATI